MARRFCSGSSVGPLGTAQDFRTPCISKRKSKCSRVAWCICTTNREPASGLRAARKAPSGPTGSGVSLNLRLRRYSSRPILVDDQLHYGILGRSHTPEQEGKSMDQATGTRLELLR